MSIVSKTSEVILIGIAGPSGCGKSTYANYLTNRLHSPFNPIELDQFFIRQVSIDHPVLGRILSEEEPETLNTDGFLTLLRQIKSTPERLTRYHRIRDDSLVDRQSICVVVEGFLLFALSDEITNLFDIRLFFESNQSECRLRRYRRDASIPSNISDEQIRIPNGFEKWFDQLVWDGYLKRRDLQKSRAQKTFHSDEYQHHHYIKLDQYIDKSLEEIQRH